MDTQSHRPLSVPSSAEAFLSIGSTSVRPLSLPSDRSSGAAPHTSNIVQGHRKKRNNVHGQDESYIHSTTIGVLPDNVLLEIFDFYRKNHNSFRIVWEWQPLVHNNLGVWPAFPIVIDYRRSKRGITPRDEDNVIAALEHPDREPFPVLTHLEISLGSRAESALALPAEFLGGFAPRLQEIILSGIPYPALPMLLLSATDLVKLDLFNIPPAGYISPEAMVASLATLPRLEILVIGFQLATSRPDQILPPPVTRIVLPALISFRFRGASEYLEDFVGRIDGPQLNQISTVYLNQVVDFQVAQFTMFVDRSVGPKIALFRHARFSFSRDSVTFTMCPHANDSPWDRRPVRTIISCQGIDWQVSHIAQVVSQISATLVNVVHLKFTELWGCRFEGTDDVEWVHLLRQFSAVQTLHVSKGLAGHVALALEDITRGVVDEVLPSLDLIYLADQPTSSIEKLIAARRLSGRSVTVIDTETEFDERLESYANE
ncbi:hypothetical protein EDB84DRAFT_1560637 [Lactarius hengduanensis]|nr:hypothetical protein EDB84DRAFT_1560637 [Lactarius hengduanensis]